MLVRICLALVALLAVAPTHAIPLPLAEHDKVAALVASHAQSWSAADIKMIHEKLKGQKKMLIKEKRHVKVNLEDVKQKTKQIATEKKDIAAYAKTIGEIMTKIGALTKLIAANEKEALLNEDPKLKTRIEGEKRRMSKYGVYMAKERERIAARVANMKKEKAAIATFNAALGEVQTKVQTFMDEIAENKAKLAPAAEKPSHKHK